MNKENLRKSSYVISIPLDDPEGKYMLIHGYTGAIDVVSKEAGLFFSDESDTLDCPADIREVWVKRGFITSKTKEEEVGFANQIAKAVHMYQQTKMKKFYFLVNYNCNFRCPYCYENLISNKGKGWTHQIMTKEIVDAAFNCMFEIEPSGEKHNKEIVLYGGEPLMADNVEIVNYIVERGNKLGYNFSAITNGYDLDLFENLLGEQQIRKIQITLDGSRKYHDSRRFHYQHGGSYDKILSNVQMALRKGIKVQIRSNIDAHNIDSVQELVNEFERLGLLGMPNFSFYPAQLKDNPNNRLDVTKSKKISYLQAEHFEKVNNLFDNNIGAYSGLILSALKSKKPLKLRPTFCGAQNGIYILDPYQHIYCCLETVGISKHIIGDYKQGLHWNTVYPLWKERDVTNVSQCKECVYALICGGGCTAKIAHIDLRTPYCNNFPTVLKANVQRAYKLYEKTA